MNIEQLPARRALDEIEQEIQNTQAIIDRPLPDIARLEREQIALSTATILDPSRRPELYECSEAVKAAKQARAERAQAKQHMLVLSMERDTLLAEQRRYKIEQANAALAQANREFEALAVQTCRAYRAVLDQAWRNSRVPGASTGYHAEFDLPFLAGRHNAGTSTARIMKGGLMDYELIEQRRVEDAA